MTRQNIHDVEELQDLTSSLLIRAAQLTRIFIDAGNFKEAQIVSTFSGNITTAVFTLGSLLRLAEEDQVKEEEGNYDNQ